METAERSVDAMMERWNIWKKGEALYPNYLLANQAAARRHVRIRRLLILTQSQMKDEATVADAIQVMDDQQVDMATAETIRPQNLLEARRMVEEGFGARIWEQEVSLFRTVVGIEGETGGGWSWDVSANYGKSESDEVFPNAPTRWAFTSEPPATVWRCRGISPKLSIATRCAKSWR